MRGDRGGGSAARTLELVVVEKKKKSLFVDVGVQVARESVRTTGYVLSYGSLARDCATGANPGRHQPSYGSVSLRVSTPPRYPRSVSVLTPCSLPLSLSRLFRTAPRRPTTFIPTRITSVTILLYFPSIPRHPFLFSLTVSSYIFFSFSLFLLSFGTDSPSFFFLPIDSVPSLSFSLPPLPLIRCLTLAFIAELHYDTFSLRELFHPPRRDRQPSRSDAFDHSRGYPIVRRVSAFSRFYGMSLSFSVFPQFPFASSTVYLCLTGCNPFLPRNHRHGPALSAGAPATIQNCG